MSGCGGVYIQIIMLAIMQVTHFRGERVAAELPVWNPSFDVTPAALIEGIITEKGMAPRVSGFQLRTWMLGQDASMHKVTSTEDSVDIGDLAGDTMAVNFKEITPSDAKQYVSSRPHLSIHVGDVESRDEWEVREVGDGNLNYVYIVTGPSGSVCIKQAPPFVRVIGSDWPLSQNRSRIEADALVEQGRLCPHHVPAVLHFDADGKVLVMQYIAPPHVTLRDGLIQGKQYPLLAEHIVLFLSRTLFKTSCIAMGGEEFRQLAKRFSNKELCGLTEQVIFTDPYYQAKNNKHTSPQLDAIVAEIQANDALKAEATRMKAVFLSKQEALVHGDFHTGSLMVTEDSTFVIDPEFAFVGPIAFDVGKFIANLLMTYFAADGLSRQDGQDRTHQKAWLLSIIESIWKGFKEEFISQWNDAIDSPTEGLCHKLVFSSTKDKGALQALQRDFFRELWTEIVGFAGCVIIRRIIGVAHVADFETIANADDRAACETRALTLAQKLLLDRECLTFRDISDITQAASPIV